MLTELIKKPLNLKHDGMPIGKSILGMKGPSVFLTVLFCSVVSNFEPDYMHGILFGEIKYLVNEWFNSCIYLANLTNFILVRLQFVV